MSQAPPPPPSSTWSKTKTGFSVVGKGASATKRGLVGGKEKLDNVSISKGGLSFKKQLSGQNVAYDRENHVSSPKVDVSHFAPPPRRVPGQVPSPRPAGDRVASTTRASVVAPPAVAARTTPPIPTATRPGSVARAVPLPPTVAARPGSVVASPGQEQGLPLYTPVATVPSRGGGGGGGGIVGDLSSRLGQMKTASPGPATAPRPSAASSSSSTTTPSMTEAKTAFGSAKTVGTLYGKYGNQQPGQKTQTPSWQEVKAGASAAQNLHSFHSKYAPKEAGAAVPQTVAVTTTTTTTTATRNAGVGKTQPVVAPKPPKPVPSTYGRSAVPTPPPPPAPSKPVIPTDAPVDGGVVGGEFCVGLYAFEAQAPGDLGFAVGDRIRVLERTEDREAWWRGALRGEEGVFPGNYCRLERA